MLDYRKQSLEAPLASSELILNLHATTLNQYDEFLTAAPLAYYIDLQKSTDGGVTWNTYWSGVNTTDIYTQRYSNAPYQINIKFNDGLGELQWHRYENSGALFVGNEQIIEIIANCLSFLPYSKNVREIINIREDTMSDASGLLEQLYLADLAFMEVGNDGLVHGIQCNKLLSQILTALNCRLYQSNNMWFVERIYERVGTSVTYFDYTMPAPGVITTNNSIVHSGTSLLSLFVSINNALQPKIISESEIAITKKQPILVYNLKTASYDNEQLVPNPYFEDTPTSKDANGRPLRWDRSANVQTKGGDKIIVVDSYSADAKYKWGYSFGSTILTAAKNELNGIGSYYPGGASYPSTYYIHGVLRTGDTYSRPWMFIDGVNGSVNVNIQLYVRININVQLHSGKYTNGYYPNTEAALLFVEAIWAMFQVKFADNSGFDHFFKGAIETPAWTGTQSACYISNTSIGGMADSWYPNGGYVHTPLDIPTLAWYITQQYKTGGNFDLIFRINRSFNIPFNTAPAPLSGSSSVDKFDIIGYAPYSAPQTIQVGRTPGGVPTGPKVFWSLKDYAFNALDYQYKDTFQSASGYTNFYNTGAYSSRWKELKIESVFGDTLTAGYPGSFRLSTAAATGTWHNRGLGDTGQVLADILFKNYVQITSQYRHNMRGKTIGIFDYWQSILDEDGRVYIQLGYTRDVKHATIDTDMEEMSDLGAVITVGHVSGATSGISFTGSTVVASPPMPIHSSISTPMAKSTGVVSVGTSAYPT